MYRRLFGTFTLRSPLSHTGESISTTAYLSEEPILQPDGSVESVFAYSGNAWRGQLRDLAATYMLDALGAPQLPVESFHLLFGGGAIGGEKSVDLQLARRFRSAIPLIAVWGGGIGNQIMEGKLRVSMAYPLCREALPVLPGPLRERAARTSYRSLTVEKSYTRTDDAKSEALRPYLLTPAATQQGALLPEPAAEAKAAPQQMRYTQELLIAGAVLATTLDVIDVSEVELGVLVSALHQFSRSPHIGGKAGTGHGLVDLEYQLLDLDTGAIEPFVTVRADAAALLAPPAEAAKAAYDQHLRAIYDAYLRGNATEALGLLGAVRA